MGKYLTERERYQIEVLLKENTSVKNIAETLGKCFKTIYNEIKRGTVELIDSELRPYKAYCADHAQAQYEYNKQFKGRELSISNDHDFVRYVEDRIINDRYSPYAVLQSIRNSGMNFKTDVCLKTLYNYIDKGIFLNVTNKDLPCKTRRKQHKIKKVKVSLKNLRGKSIEERSKDVQERAEYGHWEMDTVVSGKGTSGVCLLVLTERLTRSELIMKMDSKSQECVIKALDELEKAYGASEFSDTFKTITVDNGVEFLNQQGIDRSVFDSNQKRIISYYCHPYCPSERGSNENANKLIRRFVTKGCDISKFTEEQIRYIQDWINNYPRRLFNGLSSIGMATLKGVPAV